MKFKLIVDPHAEEQIMATVREPSALTEQIEALVLSYSGTDRLSAFRDDEIVTLMLDRVECITVIDRRVLAIDTDGVRYRLDERLFELEKRLPDSFFRINKSSIANGRHILRYRSTLGGGVDAQFRSGFVDYVSRRCFADIKRRMKL